MSLKEPIQFIETFGYHLKINWETLLTSIFFLMQLLKNQILIMPIYSEDFVRYGGKLQTLKILLGHLIITPHHLLQLVQELILKHIVMKLNSNYKNYIPQKALLQFTHS